MKTGSIARRLTGRLVAMLRSRMVSIPIVILLFCLAGLLHYRNSRLSGVPDIGHPFDFDAWGRIEFDPAENAAPDYEAAKILYRGGNSPSGDELDAVWEHGSSDVPIWLGDNQDAWRIGGWVGYKD